jgi:Synergist-CTERM protein sorting domain-containing protein
MAQRLAAIILLVAPTLGLAQTAGNGTVTVAENADQDKVVSIAECLNQKQDNLQISWTFNSGGGGPFTLLASDQTACPQSSSNGTTVTAHTTTMASGVTTNNFADTQTVATRIAAVFGANCPGTATALFVCVVDSSTNTIITGSIPLDLASPPAPVANEPTPGDGALNVSWSQGTGSVDGGTGAANGFRVYCQESATAPADTPIANKCADVTGQGTTSLRVTGLNNGTEYAVEVTAVTLSGNESGHSNRVLGTPVQIEDFWRLYRADGGREQGGCAAGAGGLAALLALAPVVWYRRRRRQ